jgi:hypothetical protein
MDLDRFRALAEAYGGDLRRWPAETRAAAETFRAGHAEAQALLDAEADFDHLLHGVAPPAASAALRQAVIASARAKPSRARPTWRFWVSGAGLVGAGAAGALAGALWISVAAGDMGTQSLLAAAAPDDTATAGWLVEGDS